jgi:hypothetical protein
MFPAAMVIISITLAEYLNLPRTLPNRFYHRVQHIGRNGVTSSKPCFSFLGLDRQTYIDERRAFIEAVERDTQPSIAGLDGRIPW